METSKNSQTSTKQDHCPITELSIGDGGGAMRAGSKGWLVGGSIPTFPNCVLYNWNFPVVQYTGTQFV